MTSIADGVDESGLAALIERSSELKHDLVEFAYTPRLRPHLMRRLQEAADDDEELDEGEELGEGEFIEVVDRFVLEGRLPGGKTVLNLFLASRRDLIPDLSEVGILPPEMEDSDTVGLIYDEVDGLNYYDDYGMLRDLFADPGLAADRRYASVLRGYLASDTIGPLPFRRLVAAYPSTADAVFRKILRKPTFAWAEHGEALLRKRKPWYYESEPRPGISVIGDRLAELTGHRKA